MTKLTKKKREKLQNMVDHLVKPAYTAYEKAYMEAVVAGEGWLKVHPDGRIEHIQKFFGCQCGEKKQT